MSRFSLTRVKSLLGGDAYNWLNALFAKFATDANDNIIGTVNPNSGRILSGTLNKLKTAIASAYNNNWVTNTPWCLPPLWTADTQFTVGDYVRNSNNDMYIMVNTDVFIASVGVLDPYNLLGTTASGVGPEPTHTSKVTAAWDTATPTVAPAAGQAGCLWKYVGSASSILSINGISTGCPLADTVAEIATLDGLFWGGTNTGYNLAAGATIVAGTGANSAKVGQGLLTATITYGEVKAGAPLLAAGVAAGTFIVKKLTAGTWVVNKTQTVNIAGIVGNGGGLTPNVLWGLTNIIPVVGVNSPVSFYGYGATNRGTAAVPVAFNTGGFYEFKTNARWIGLLNQRFGANWSSFVTVNNRLLQLGQMHIIDSASVATPQSLVLLNLAKIPTADGNYTVRIYSEYSEYPTNASIYVAPADSVWKVDDDSSITLTFDGDSTSIGEIGGGSVFGFGTKLYGYKWQNQLCSLLGVKNHHAQAEAGTGFINNNSNTRTTYLERLPYITAQNPSIHVIHGSTNDAAQPTLIQAAVYAYGVAFRAANPNAYLIITGSRVTNIHTGAQMVIADTAIAAAVTQLNDANIMFIPTITDPTGDTTNSSGWWWGGLVAGRYFGGQAGTSGLGGHPFIDDHYMFASRLASVIKNRVSSIYN